MGARIALKIGLIDVDGKNFPNIPLMKLSAWHKSNGDTVEWYEPLFSGHMDKVYMSKVFSGGDGEARRNTEEIFDFDGYSFGKIGDEAN